MSHEPEEIIARLLVLAAMADEKYPGHGDTETFEAAAEALADLSRKLNHEALVSDKRAMERDRAEVRLAAKDEQIKALRAGLEPFAFVAEVEGYDKPEEDAEEWFRWDGLVLRVGDFRRARALLSGATP